MLTGCATRQPQQEVTGLDPSSARYASQECRDARMLAMTYDDNVGGRVGVGLGLGLLLGPFGIPFAMAVDASQAQKRDAVNAELVKHCGAVMKAKAAPPPSGNPTSTGCQQGATPSC